MATLVQPIATNGNPRATNCNLLQQVATLVKHRFNLCVTGYTILFAKGYTMPIHYYTLEPFDTPEPYLFSPFCTQCCTLCTTNDPCMASILYTYKKPDGQYLDIVFTSANDLCCVIDLGQMNDSTEFKLDSEQYNACKNYVTMWLQHCKPVETRGALCDHCDTVIDTEFNIGILIRSTNSHFVVYTSNLMNYHVTSSYCTHCTQCLRCDSCVHCEQCNGCSHCSHCVRCVACTSCSHWNHLCDLYQLDSNDEYYRVTRSRRVLCSCTLLLGVGLFCVILVLVCVMV